MTILDQIKREAEALPVEAQEKALKLLRSMRSEKKEKKVAAKPGRKTLGEARSTFKAVKGMWRDRADLPGDTAEASMELRRRLMRRKKNG